LLACPDRGQGRRGGLDGGAHLLLLRRGSVGEDRAAACERACDTTPEAHPWPRSGPARRPIIAWQVARVRRRLWEAARRCWSGGVATVVAGGPGRPSPHSGVSAGPAD